MTFFCLVPFGDGVFLLAAETGPSGTPSLETFNSSKILVGFNWKKAETWRHDILWKLGILTEIVTLKFNVCSNSLSLYIPERDFVGGASHRSLSWAH